MIKVNPLDRLMQHAEIGERVVSLIRESGLLRRKRGRTPRIGRAAAVKTRLRGKPSARSRTRRSILDDPSQVTGKES